MATLPGFSRADPEIFLNHLLFSRYMDFTIQKSRHLEKLGSPDNSKIGLPDPQIMPLLDTLNSLPDFYTTSSCAGRIILMDITPERKKHQTVWLHTSHDPLPADISLEKRKGRRRIESCQVWFKMESPILHVCARTLPAAEHLITLCHQVGIKHAGIIGTKKRMMVEIFDAVRTEALIAADGDVLVSDGYIRRLVEDANAKLEVTRHRLARLRALL